MFVPFLYELRKRGVPVGAQEALNLAAALEKGLHESSLEGFYYVARATMIHSEAHLDDFDQVFGHVFEGKTIEEAVNELHDELFDWLKDAKETDRELTEEERAFLESLDMEELERMFQERLKEQKERHDGGNKWVGTGGTSPFGNSGKSTTGIRVGGKGGGRSAVKVADARLYKGYRQDLTLDTRQMQVALRKLRQFVREGALDELDLEGTIDATAKNAGEIEVVVRPPRKSNTKVILMMDVGGSMDPYAHLVSRLFSATKKSSHFRELRTYYFHNCVYGVVYGSEKFDEPMRARDLLHECNREYKLIMVGDALMAPYELMAAGGSAFLGDDRGIEGITWLMELEKHFERAVWLNPEPKKYWKGNTIEYVNRVFEMFPLTLEGLGEAVQHLNRGARARV